MPGDRFGRDTAHELNGNVRLVKQGRHSFETLRGLLGSGD